MDSSKFSVLFVDDEVENLRVFQLAFRRDFRIRTAQGAAEGLELLAQEPAAVVLSDQRMPGMTGVEFLTRVREFDPDTVRMLVTAYGDNETLSEAINQGSIARYIAKPWSPDEMRVAVRQGLEAYARDSDRRALVEELEILNRASALLCSELEITPVVDRLLSIVVKDLGFDGATVMLRTPDGDALEVIRTHPRNTSVHTHVEGLHIPLRHADMLLPALEDRQVVRVTLGQLFELDAAFREFAAEVAAEEMLLIPLPGRSGSLGVMAVDNRSGGVPFDHANRTLLASLGAQSSIAIDNARLMEDLRQSRELTRRADRLGTLGTLAAGLAHEINNPLVSIQTFLNMAPEKRDADDPEFWGEYHELACCETERIRTLVHSMSRLGSHAEGELGQEAEPLDIEALAGEALQLVAAAQQSKQVEVELDVRPSGLLVRGVRDHLHQLLTNLLINAIHASPSGGKVVVSARAASGDSPEVAIEVRDWGSGMSAEVLDRVFDPFFTTKSPDQGAGLGLMICHRIATDHGGTIAAESEEGSGSTFRVQLPGA